MPKPRCAPLFRGLAATCCARVRHLSSIDAQDKETPLHLAAQQNNLKILRLLLKAGANTEAKDSVRTHSVQSSRRGALHQEAARSAMWH